MTDLLTPREVADLLRCNLRTVMNYRRAGKLRFEKHSSRSYRYERRSVEEFREQSRGECDHTLARDSILGGQYCTKCKANFQTC